MSVTAIDADRKDLTDEEKAAIAEFEAEIPFHMKVQIGLAKMWDRIGQLCDMTAPTLDRLDRIQTQLMRRVFDERDRSIIIDGDVHPLIDKKTRRPVPLLKEWSEVEEVALWAMMIPKHVNDRRVEEGRAIRQMARWLRWNVGYANRVAIGVVTFVRAFKEYAEKLQEETEDE